MNNVHLEQIIIGRSFSERNAFAPLAIRELSKTRSRTVLISRLRDFEVWIIKKRSNRIRYRIGNIHWAFVLDHVQNSLAIFRTL